MRTVTFQSVLHGVARLLGLRPAADLTPSRAATLTEYINERLKEGWTREFWPEWTICRQRQYRPDYDAAENVLIGAERYHAATDKYYRAIQDQTPAAEPPTNAAFWTPCTTNDFEASLPYEGVAADDVPMDMVKRVCLRNPRQHPIRPGEIAWEATDTGILVGKGLQVTRPWVEFRRVPPVFDSQGWSALEAVTAGAIRYYTATGECYVALQDGTGKVPTSEPTYWRKIEFPAVLAGWVKKAALSDALRDLKQTDRAASELRLAEEELEDAVDRVLGAQGMWDRAKVEC
jgi:hypothetical protein